MARILARNRILIFLCSCFLVASAVTGFCQAAPPAAPPSQTQSPAGQSGSQQPSSDQTSSGQNAPQPQSGQGTEPRQTQPATQTPPTSQTPPSSPTAPASQTAPTPEVLPTAPESHSDAPYQRQNGRIFGVIPNYRTVEDEDREPSRLSVKEKFVLGLKDSFDPYAYPAAGLFAGISMWKKQTPSFGQGAAGFGRYFGTAFADETIGNMMSESVFPSLLHQDPRYFPMGRGHGFWERMGYAISREWITRGDSGKREFNYSEIGGNATAVAISNVYYPKENRNVSDNASKFGQQIGLDAFFDVLKEFWPDIRHKVFGK